MVETPSVLNLSSLIEPSKAISAELRRSADILKSVRKGTKVNIIVQQSPYLYGNKVGTKFVVVGVQIVELVTGNGAVDSGTLTAEEVAGMFGKVDGFKASEPAVRAESAPEPVAAGASAYNF